MRLSIEVTSEQHQRLKVVTALRGQSIKDYVLDRVLPDTLAADEDEALCQLRGLPGTALCTGERHSYQ